MADTDCTRAAADDGARVIGGGARAQTAATEAMVPGPVGAAGLVGAAVTGPVIDGGVVGLRRLLQRQRWRTPSAAAHCALGLRWRRRWRVPELVIGCCQ